jgi:GNAT superfamily N-acetyltransferase
MPLTARTPPAPIDYRDELPSPEDFLRLFAAAGWRTRASAERIAGALEAAWHSVVAFEGDRLVGMGHTISDGVIHALVVDVIVDPEWQGRGIGREIMRRLIARCDEAGIESIQLFAATGKSPFYEKLGFTARPADAPGMELRPQP